MSYGKIPQPRDQIVYKPRGKGSVQYGFVVEVTFDGVRCRFWIMESGKVTRTLRTTANSELCDIEFLKVEFLRRTTDIDAICDAHGWAMDQRPAKGEEGGGE